MSVDSVLVRPRLPAAEASLKPGHGTRHAWTLFATAARGGRERREDSTVITNLQSGGDVRGDARRRLAKIAVAAVGVAAFGVAGLSGALAQVDDDDGVAGSGASGGSGAGVFEDGFWEEIFGENFPGGGSGGLITIGSGGGSGGDINVGGSSGGNITMGGGGSGDISIGGGTSGSNSGSDSGSGTDDGFYD